MRKKISAAAFTSTLLIAAIAATLLVNLATPLPFPEVSYSVTLQSPENKVYATSNVPLAFTVNFATLENIVNHFVEFKYILDGQEPKVLIDGPGQAQSGSSYPYSTVLSGLAEGSHSITVGV